MGRRNLPTYQGPLQSSLPGGVFTNSRGPNTFDKDTGQLTDAGIAHQQAMRYYFGVEPGLYDLTKPGDQQRISHYDLPKAFGVEKGHPRENDMMKEIVIAIITQRECDLTDTFLPREEETNFAKFKNYTTWIFNDSLPDTVPHEGVPRMLTMCERTTGYMYKRIGKMFQMEFGFWQTPIGHLQYELSLQQIANGIIEYSNLDAAIECLTAQYIDPNRNIAAAHNIDNQPFEALMDDEAAQMFRVQKNPLRGWDELVESMRNEISKRGFDPGQVQGLAVPAGMRQYIAEAKAFIPFIFTGARQGDAWNILDGNKKAIPGRYIYVESRGIRQGDGLPPLDPFYSIATIGTFWNVTYQYFKNVLELGTYTGSMLTPDVFNLSKNHMEKFPFNTAIGGSGLYHGWDTERPEKSDWFEKYFPGVKTMWDWYQLCGAELRDYARKALTRDYLKNDGTDSTLLQLCLKHAELTGKRTALRMEHGPGGGAATLGRFMDEYAVSDAVPRNRKRARIPVPGMVQGATGALGAMTADANERNAKSARTVTFGAVATTRAREDVRRLIDNLVQRSDNNVGMDKATCDVFFQTVDQLLATVQTSATSAQSKSSPAHVTQRLQHIWTLLFDALKREDATLERSPRMIPAFCWSVISKDLLAVDLDLALNKVQAQVPNWFSLTGVEKHVARSIEPSFDAPTTDLTALYAVEAQSSPAFANDDLAVLSVYEGASFATSCPLSLPSEALTLTSAYVEMFSLTRKQVDILSDAQGDVAMALPKSSALALAVDWGVNGQRRMALCQYSLCLSALLHECRTSSHTAALHERLLSVVPLVDHATHTPMAQTMAIAEKLLTVSPGQAMFAPIIAPLRELFAALYQFKSSRSPTSSAEQSTVISALIQRIRIACDGLGEHPASGAALQPQQQAATGALGATAYYRDTESASYALQSLTPQEWLRRNPAYRANIVEWEDKHAKIVRSGLPGNADLVALTDSVYEPYSATLVQLYQRMQSEVQRRVFAANIQLLDALYRVRPDQLNAFLKPITAEVVQQNTVVGQPPLLETPKEFTRPLETADVISALLWQWKLNPFSLIVNVGTNNPSQADFDVQGRWEHDLLTIANTADEGTQLALRSLVDQFLVTRHDEADDWIMARGVVSGALSTNAYRASIAPVGGATAAATPRFTPDSLKNGNGQLNIATAAEAVAIRTAVGLQDQGVVSEMVQMLRATPRPEDKLFVFKCFVVFYNQQYPQKRILDISPFLEFDRGNATMYRSLWNTPVKDNPFLDHAFNIVRSEEYTGPAAAAAVGADGNAVNADVGAHIGADGDVDMSDADTAAFERNLDDPKMRLKMLLDAKKKQQPMSHPNVQRIVDITLRMLPVSEGAYLKIIIPSSCPPPVGYIGAEPFIELEKADALMGAIAGAMGRSFHGQEVLMLGDDGVRMVHTCTWVGYTKAKVLHPEYLVQRRAVFMKRLIGGATFKIQDPLSPEHVTQMTNGVTSGDVFITPVPFTFESTSNTHVMSGVIPSEFKSNNREQERMNYPGSNVQCEIWHWNRFNQSHYVTDDTFMHTLRANNMRSNIICRRLGVQFNQGPGQRPIQTNDATPFSINGRLTDGCLDNFYSERPKPINPLSLAVHLSSAIPA